MMSSIDPAPKPKPSIKKDVEEEEGALPPAGSEAPFNPRFIAGLIDVGVVVGLEIVLSIVLPHALHFVISLIGLAYLLLRDALPFLNGQSIGKKAMKLKAVDESGKSLSGNWQASAVRNVSLLIPFVDLIILWQKSQQPNTRLLRLGDEWAKTHVVVAPDDAPVIPPPAG
jgi:uncharacterized RDD family membrane protein YckC